MNFSEFNSTFGELETPENIELELYKSKQNVDMIKSTQLISTINNRELHDIVKKKNVECNVSLGIVLNLTPFYVQPPSDRENESCLCKFNLNLQLHYNELQKHLKSDVLRGVINVRGFVVDTYYDKKGEFKTGSRTAKKMMEESFHDVIKDTEAKRSIYLKHRYECKNDQYVWPQILD